MLAKRNPIKKPIKPALVAIKVMPFTENDVQINQCMPSYILTAIPAKHIAYIIAPKVTSNVTLFGFFTRSHIGERGYKGFGF